MTWIPSALTASDGIRLAVFTCGASGPDVPTVLLVHGYPDDHHVWDAVAGRLADRCRVVAFDVRGAGASGVPAARRGYRVAQLAEDIALVAASVTAGPVHLVGHDWGSVQSWAAVTDPATQFSTYTSISGPDVAYAGAWVKSAWSKDRRAAGRQIRSSWYIGLFLLPVLPELLWRSGLGHRLLGRDAPARSVPDAVRGLSLYRANMSLRGGARPRPCAIPVQVIAPRRDRYITLAMATGAPRPWVADLRVVEIDGGHWAMTRHPERVADPVAEFVLGR